MQVSEVVALSFKDGPQVFLPESLIHEDSDGKKWLKFRPSSATLAKLLLGHMPEFKKIRNPSLTASPQVKKLQDKIREAILQQQPAEKQKDGDMFASEPAQERQEGENEAQNQNQEKKQREMKQLLLKCPSTLNVSLGGNALVVRTPKSFKETDIVVELKASSLTLLADFILEDIQPCLSEKREYTRSGQFAKKAKLLEAQD